MDIQRSLLQWALDPALLGERMAFIAGPRQVGKTTLLRDYLAAQDLARLYFNWDIAQVRQAARRDIDFFTAALPPAAAKLTPVVFDEIHKVPRWKTLLKGWFDAWQGRLRFIVTGSARLDFMRKSGDSLVGRFFLYRKLPLHPRECSGGGELPDWLPGQNSLRDALPPAPSADFAAATQTLWRSSGFPEPFLKGSERFLRRWQSEHASLLVTEDLAELTKIEQVLRVEELVELLRHRVGAPLSTNRLSQDLQASFASIKRWLEGLDLVYLTFTIPPYVGRLTRALRKEPKLYFWDWSFAEGEAAQLENMVAVQLMRAVCSWNERGLGRYSLAYVRTRDGVECDFVVLQQRRPVLLVEVKTREEEISPALLKIKGWLEVDSALQVVGSSDRLREHRQPGVFLLSLDRFLQMTP